MSHNVTYVLFLASILRRCTTASQSSTGPCCYCQSRPSQVPCVKAVAQLQPGRLRLQFGSFQLYPAFWFSWFRDLEFFFMPPFHRLKANFHQFSSFCIFCEIYFIFLCIFFAVSNRRESGSRHPAQYFRCSEVLWND